MSPPVRCAICGLTIKWGQDRTIKDNRRDPPGLVAACPVCAVETGQWPAPKQGDAR